jgi:hypothetical protein
MLGQTLIGSRLRDLRTVMHHLRERYGVDAFGLWGDSFAPTNPVGFADPLLGDGTEPPQAEPMGGLLALLGTLFEDDVSATVCRRSLPGFRCALSQRFLYLPYDAIVPGALRAGDLGDIVAALCPRQVWLADLVDARNCPLPPDDAGSHFGEALAAYTQAGTALRLDALHPDEAAAWLTESLMGSAGR